MGEKCVKDVVQYGLEAVGAYGPFSVQAEYLGTHYDRDGALIEELKTPGGTSVNFSGYYVYATWYLTGESRAQAYRTYPKTFNFPGTFDQIPILSPVSAGGTGAWEAAAICPEQETEGLSVFAPTGLRRPEIVDDLRLDWPWGTEQLTAASHLGPDPDSFDSRSFRTDT